jgi:hypothetical protein
MLRSHLLALGALLLCVGCGSTGQREVSYPLFASGQAPAPFRAGDWEVTLEVARVGFGPAYFCATAAASSDLCPAAVAEFAQSAEFDALSPTPQQLGSIEGVSGTIRSATYDYAYTWLTTQRSPRPTAAAPRGHSAHFEGRATRGARTIRFVADVDVLPQTQGTRVVQGARAEADVQDSNVRLDLRVDAAAWWRNVDFEELAQSDRDIVVVPPTSRAYSAVVIAMTATATPVLEWSRP